MNASDKLPLPSLLDQDTARRQASALFPLESLQNLDVDSARRCQTMLGHGGTFGIWETPEAMVPHMRQHMRSIDLRRRIASKLPNSRGGPDECDRRVRPATIFWVTNLVGRSGDS